MEKKKEKKILKQIVVVIAILSTYVMVFLLGRITNVLTLGVKDEEKPDDDTVVIEPTKKPTYSPNDIEGQEPKEDEESEIPDGVIILWEGKKKWEQLEELNIFNGIFYEKDYTNKIAPGFSGTYEFDLENTSDKPITYILAFEEENPDEVNMVYKVMREDRYVLGNDIESVYIDGVKLEEITIPANTKRRYTLKWKWEDTSYDTQIGEKNNTQYKLKVKIQATVNE